MQCMKVSHGAAYKIVGIDFLLQPNILSVELNKSIIITRTTVGGYIKGILL